MGETLPHPRLLLHRSPGITAIYNEIKGWRANRILDLGPSSAKSFQFFAQLSCKIRFENLNELFTRPIQNDTTLICLLGDYLNDFQQQDSYDIVLTWDLFNYLDLPSVIWLMEKLRSHCRPGALIHAVKYVSANIPASPCGFHVLDQYQLQIELTSDPTLRQQPSHETARFLRQIKHFHMEHSYLSFDGMVPGVIEHVLRHQPEPTSVARPKSREELRETPQSAVHIENSRQLHHSSALASAFGKITPGSHPMMLDLGQKNRTNFNIFQRLTQNLYAEDIYADLQLQHKRGIEVGIKAHMLNFSPDTRFDVILLWDLLNFMPPPLIQDLFRRLAFWVHEETRIHAIVYSGQTVPTAPQTFLLKDLSLVEIEPAKKRHAHGQLLTSSHLLKLMQVFRLAETHVFRPGMQRGIYEYLFCREAPLNS